MHKAIDIHAHFGNPEGFPQKSMEGIFPSRADVLLDANSCMEELAQANDWIYQWVIVNPLMPESYKQAAHGNIYTDVSSARSILNRLVEWAVESLTVEKLLFGTDAPLHHIPMMKQRIEFAELTEQEKECIFYKNAINLLQGDLNNE